MIYWRCGTLDFVGKGREIEPLNRRFGPEPHVSVLRLCHLPPLTSHNWNGENDFCRIGVYCTELAGSFRPSKSQILWAKRPRPVHANIEKRYAGASPKQAFTFYAAQLDFI